MKETVYANLRRECQEEEKVTHRYMKQSSQKNVAEYTPIWKNVLGKDSMNLKPYFFF